MRPSKSVLATLGPAGPVRLGSDRAAAAAAPAIAWPTLDYAPARAPSWQGRLRGPELQGSHRRTRHRTARLPCAVRQVLLGAGRSTDEIVLPVDSDQVDWEVELAVVIGRPMFRASEEEALAAVAGYAVSTTSPCVIGNTGPANSCRARPSTRPRRLAPGLLPVMTLSGRSGMQCLARSTARSYRTPIPQISFST